MMPRTATGLSKAEKAELDRILEMSEDDLLTAIIEAALFMGWLVHHDRRSDKALQQGSSGFPDLVLARNGKVKFLEFRDWAIEYRLVRPSDLDDVIASLR